MKFLSLFPILFLSYSMFATEYRYIDGSGNRYSLDTGASLSFVYEPMTPEQSSSGFYSGGEPKSGKITEAQGREFEKILNSLDPNIYAKKIDRKKGTGLLIWSKNSKEEIYYFGFADPNKERLEQFLKMTKEKMGNQFTNDLPSDFKVRVSREESPWLGMTGSYEEEEKSKYVSASDPNGKNVETFPNGKETIFSKDPLIFYTSNPKEVKVNQRYFSDLRRIDVTKLKVGEFFLVGTVKSPLLQDPTSLISFLLKGQILITYWHTDAEIGLLNTFHENQKTCYLFGGVHHFYTNEKNSMNYQFQICIDRVSGEMKVKEGSNNL